MDKETALFNIMEVTLPIDSFGQCMNWRRCKNYQVQLGNGLCVACYDKGLEHRYTNIRIKQDVRREKNPYTVDYYYAQRAKEEKGR